MEIIPSPRYTLCRADAADRQQIYKMRHEIYAKEIGQHQENDSGMLSDALDEFNHYIVAKAGSSVIGFVSITPPHAPHFSIDKYFDRASLPLQFNDSLFELRLLSISENYRSGPLAFLLMFASMRWISSHGGNRLVAICRTDLMEMYKKAGIEPLGLSVKSGAVKYELGVASVNELYAIADRKNELCSWLNKRVDWQLPFGFEAPANCYHGGSFFKAIGEDLQSLEKRHDIINADVLDAWFAPSPRITVAMQQNLSWLLQTSPPTQCEGMVKAISEARGLPEASVLPGAGSSDLIFLALRQWLTDSSRVLVLDPCYGEYTHVLGKIIGCSIGRFMLKREDGFAVNTVALLEEIQKGYDMVVIVNPNSPTGIHVPQKAMRDLLMQVPETTIVWIDETYIEYAGKSASLERFAVQRENVVVCKSMSKVYALSGVRAAYLCGSPHLIEGLRSLSPPWAVSLPAQLAAITALRDTDYYESQYRETHALREELKNELYAMGMDEVIPGIANFLLFFLPENYPDAKTFISLCMKEGVYLRDIGNMGTGLGDRAVRIAVKDRPANRKMTAVMQKVISGYRHEELLPYKIEIAL